MPRFEYKARNISGVMVTGALEAASADVVAGDLFGQNITPIEIKQVAGLKVKKTEDDLTTVEKINMFLAGKKVPINELIVFARQMQSLTRAGLPLDRALNGLQASLKNPLFKSVLQDVLKGLESGQDLAAALGRHPKIFSPLFLSLVSVGENTGRLDMAFEQVGKYLELEKNTRKQIKTATRYPIFVLLTIAVALAVITVFVIPAFADTFRRLQAELPLETRILIAISDFVIAWWPFMIGGTLALVLAVRTWIRTKDGRLTWDRRKMQLPLAGTLFEQIALARFARAFAMILKAGVPIVHGMSVVAGAVGNAWISKNILGMQDGVTRGESLYRTAQNSGMFTPLVLQMLSVGEESGTIDDLMAEVAEFYDAEVEYNLKRLSEAIEPILIMIIAGMVLVLALGVFLPIWDLSSAANR
ncbi:MAG: type II secretion system F family protein [Gammaproteobacteria bacterium]|nr:type II secretion system F family protein [Gammaproteobacteria bacterium]MDP2347749.1 type II secretion system F family protein [Gammaproteobacteria bacterium]